MAYARGWRRARQVSQVISTALFFLLAALTYRGSELILPPDLFLRLDPLAAFAAMLAARTLITTLLLSLLVLGLAFIAGRVWCGWLCPLGALLDWLTPTASTHARKAEPHPSWRALKYGLLVALLVMALLGSLMLVVFDPLTLLYRTFAGAFLPALNVVVTSAEMTLYAVEPLQPVLEAFESAVRGTVLPAQQTYSELGWLFASLLAVVVALNWVVPRFWCRYLCPLGAMYALPARAARFRLGATADCNHCARCMQVCPTGAITVTKAGMQLNAAECVMCMDCVAACSSEVISWNKPHTQTAQPASGLSRREVLGSVTLGVAAFALARSAPSARHNNPYLIRPPGAQFPDFLSRCIRCGECVRVCPTGGLQSGMAETGLEGLWSPNLIARLGYCDYSCNACGAVCPTGAIPLLSLEDKRQTVIGTAYIDTARCLPYASDNPCIVCEEMCPLSPKAISLDEVDVTRPNGQKVHLQRPKVDHALCIGCGICEYQCPLPGPAAIRVRVPTQLPGPFS